VADFKDTISLVAKNLFTLEVNTIIKANILGTKMPPAVHALLDIASDYDAQLSVYEAELAMTPVEQPAAAKDETGKHVANEELFHWLRRRADDCMGSFRDPAATRFLVDLKLRLLLLQRIKDNCDQIRSIFQGLAHRKAELPKGKALSREATSHGTADLPLHPNELLTLRKIWEIGLEEILAQTVIQVDGDVTTRVHPNVVSGDMAQLLNIHQQSVSNSVGIWKGLASMLGSFMENVGQLVLRK